MREKFPLRGLRVNGMAIRLGKLRWRSLKDGICKNKYRGGTSDATISTSLVFVIAIFGPVVFVLVYR